MPISIDYNSKRNVIYTKAVGVIRLADTLSYYNAVADLDLKPNYRVFADYTKAILELSSEDIYSMAKQRNLITKINDKIRIAVLCAKDHVFGMGRMYEAHLNQENHEVMVFRDEKIAKDWLKL